MHCWTDRVVAERHEDQGMGSLRTLLALSVVLSHTGGTFLVGGRNAVQMFYVISGFLISYVLVEVRSYKSVGAFYANRYLRLFPIYAVVAVLTLAAYIAKGEPDFLAVYAKAPKVADAILALANATLFLQDWVMFLGVREGVLRFVKDFNVSDPQLYRGLLAWQAWTLGVELTFYLVAPFLLRSRRLIYSALGLSVALRLLFVALGFGLIDPWTYRFFPTELALFLCGSLAQQLVLKRYTALSATRLKNVARSATFGMLTLCIFYPILPMSEEVKSMVLLCSFIVLTPATFEFQRTTPWDNWIGKLSYPIYICHMLVLWIVHHLFWHFGWESTSALTALTLAGSVALAYLLDVYVGGPVERLRARQRNRSDPVQEEAVAGGR